MRRQREKKHFNHGSERLHYNVSSVIECIGLFFQIIVLHFSSPTRKTDAHYGCNTVVKFQVLKEDAFLKRFRLSLFGILIHKKHYFKMYLQNKDLTTVVCAKSMDCLRSRLWTKVQCPQIEVVNTGHTLIRVVLKGKLSK